MKVLYSQGTVTITTMWNLRDLFYVGISGTNPVVTGATGVDMHLDLVTQQELLFGASSLLSSSLVPGTDIPLPSCSG